MSIQICIICHYKYHNCEFIDPNAPHHVETPCPSLNPFPDLTGLQMVTMEPLGQTNQGSLMEGTTSYPIIIYNADTAATGYLIG